MVQLTGGEIIKVKPTEIISEFSNLLSTEVIATHVKLSVKLHKLMSFRNESPNEMKYNGSTLVKDIGNATNESELYIEYNFKPEEEIVKNFPNMDLEKMEVIPFQSIIEYTSKTGDKCIRVVTSLQKVSSDKEEIAKDAKYQILSVNAMQKSSQLAKEGKFRKAQANAKVWKQMIKSKVGESKEAEEGYKMFNRNMRTFNKDIQQEQYVEIQNNFVNNNQHLNQNLECDDNIVSRKMKFTDKVSNQIHNLNNMNFSKAAKKK